MDAIMRESSFAQYLTQQGIDRGIEQGIEQGIQESIQEALEVRFGSVSVYPFVGRIRAIDDLQRLKQLLREAVQVDNLDAFQHALDAEA